MYLSAFSKDTLIKDLGNWVNYVEYPTLVPIVRYLNQAYISSDAIIYPKMDEVFKAFRLTQPEDLKVVIIGQDPYPSDFANGLAFSIDEECTRTPPSLINILKEVERTEYKGLKLEMPRDLTHWAEQGVLLLNTALTVKAGMPGSHIDLWKHFTEEIITSLSERKSGIIYLLWGKYAQYYKNLINPQNNFILEAGHPSPLNTKTPFIGCGHFAETNKILTKYLKTPIKW